MGVLRTWIRTDWVENRTYANDGTYTATRQVFGYESTYGNLLTQTDQSWNGSSWVNYRSTSTEYFPNASAYLVSLPARQQIKDANNAVIAESLNLYDSNSVYNAAPTAGVLTVVRLWIDGTLSTGRYSQVTYAYDAWGNQTTVTTYSGYGNASTAPTAGTRTSTTVYDPSFHAYPISQTTPPTSNAPSGLTTTWMYDYDGDGLNDYILGVPTGETDPNGNSTTAQYDIFGRMTKLIRPGNTDSSSNPTIAIDYHDTALFWTEIRQRIDGARYLTIRRHYDGIGRPTYVENGSTNAGAFTLNNTVAYGYPAFNIVQQSMPYAPGGSAFYTTTTSDALGRPVTVTAPNGNQTSYAYDGLMSTVTDAKGYSTTTTTDVWGRVLSITPPTGPSVTYTYDGLNNLITALRGGVTTEIKYDRAGRKVGMDDPDMGMAGNIISDHAENVLTGEDFSAEEHLITSTAGAAQGLVAGQLTTVTTGTVQVGAQLLNAGVWGGLDETAQSGIDGSATLEDFKDGFVSNTVSQAFNLGFNKFVSWDADAGVWIEPPTGGRELVDVITPAFSTFGNWIVREEQRRWRNGRYDK